MKTPISTLSALVVIAMATPAFAQYASDYGAIDPGTDPGVVGEFASLDRMSPRTNFGADLGFAYYRGDDDALLGDIDILTLRLDLHGQFVAANGFGGYASLPVTRAMVEDVEDVTGVGNLDVGGFGVFDTGPTTTIIGRFGVFLPTADEDGDGAAANLLGLPARVTDFYGAAPDVTTLRLSASPTYRSGNGFFRADIGLDLPIDEPEGTEQDPALRVNAGGGIDTGSTRLMGELALVDVFDQDITVVTAMLSARFGTGSVRPGISIGAPIYTNDEIEVLFDTLDPIVAIFSLQVVPQMH